MCLWRRGQTGGRLREGSIRSPKESVDLDAEKNDRGWDDGNRVLKKYLPGLESVRFSRKVVQEIYRGIRVCREKSLDFYSERAQEEGHHQGGSLEGWGGTTSKWEMRFSQNLGNTNEET